MIEQRSGQGMIGNIQLLRGIAAAMVVMVHIQPLMVPLGYVHSGNRSFGAGVDIFFVISGFIMIYVTSRRDTTAAAFLVDRLIRIIPTYWLFTIILFAVANVTSFGTWQANPSHTLQSLFFLPLDGRATFTPVLYVGWTLNLEMAFYVMFALGLALSSSLWSRVAITVALISLPMAVALVAPRESLWPVYGQPMMLEFALGMLIGSFHAEVQTIPKPIAVTMVVLGGILIPTMVALFDVDRLFFAGIPAVLIVAGALACEAHGLHVRSDKWLTFGAISYAVYISHPLVLSAFNNAQERMDILQSPTGSAAVSAVALISVFTIAYLTHVLFEVPIAKLLRTRLAALPLHTRSI